MPRNQLQDGGCFQSGRKVLVTWITRGTGDQQSSAGRQTLSSTGAGGWRQAVGDSALANRAQGSIPSDSHIDSNLHSPVCIFKFQLLHSISTKTLLSINIWLSRGSSFCTLKEITIRQMIRDQNSCMFLPWLLPVSLLFSLCQYLLQMFQASDLLR